MKYHAIFFTDMSARIWHARPIGAYRLASELRKQGYNVLVLDFLSKWLLNPRDFDKLLKTIISDETCFVGYSGTFFSQNTEITSTLNSINDFYKADTVCHWPTDVSTIKLLNRRIKSLNPNIKIFYGGALANFLTELLKPDVCGVDYIVQGYSDSYIADILNKLQSKQHIPYTFENNCKVIKYDITGQQFDFFNHGQTVYHKSDCFSANEIIPIETSRGCMFKCKFCSFPLLGRKKNDKSYHKCQDVVAEEIKQNYENFGVSRYMFVDDTFNESTSKIEEIQNAVKKSGVDIKFCCFLRLDLIERFPEQIELLKNMGMQSAYLGIETLHGPSARAVGKNSDPESVKRTLELMRKSLGDQCIIHASFILGLPNETEETFTQWISWVYDHPDLIDSYRINVLSLNDQNASWPSVIAKNPEKYGYTFDDNHQWINNAGMTQQQATDLTNRWLEKSWTNGRLKLSSYDIMGLQNLGYTFDELKCQTINNLPIKDIKQRYEQMFETYKHRIYNYLSK